MKTLKIFKTIFVLFAMLLTLVSCGKKDEEDSSNVDVNEVIESEGAKEGDIVLVHYTLSSEEGEKLESSYDVGSPIEFELGGQGIISGFNKGVLGMKIGEKKTITLLPEDAYGERVEGAIQVVPRSELAEFEQMGVVLEKGNTLPTMYGNLEILEADEENITIDMNHPMAGKTLIFDMELVEIKDKSQVEELPSFDLSEVQVEDLPSDIGSEE